MGPKQRRPGESGDPVIVPKDLQGNGCEHVIVLKHVPTTVNHETLDRILQRFGAVEVVSRSKGVAYARFKEQSAAVKARKQLHGIRMGSSVISVHYFPPSLSTNRSEPLSTPADGAPPPSPPAAAAAAAAAGNSATAVVGDYTIPVPADMASHQDQSHTSPPPDSPSSLPPLTDPSLCRLVQALESTQNQPHTNPPPESPSPLPPLTDPSLCRLIQALLAFRETEKAAGQEKGRGQEKGSENDKGKEQDEGREREKRMEQGATLSGAGAKGQLRSVEAGAEWKEEGYYPFPPPHFRYAYPPATPTTIINIAFALIATPRLYTQVLHLMNKMSLPPPFGPVVLPPALQISALKQPAAEQGLPHEAPQIAEALQEPLPQQQQQLPPQHAANQSLPAGQKRISPSTFQIQQQQQQLPHPHAATQSLPAGSSQQQLVSPHPPHPLHPTPPVQGPSYQPSQNVPPTFEIPQQQQQHWHHQHQEQQQHHQKYQQHQQQQQQRFHHQQQQLPQHHHHQQQQQQHYHHQQPPFQASNRPALAPLPPRPYLGPRNPPPPLAPPPLAPPPLAPPSLAPPCLAPPSLPPPTRAPPTLAPLPHPAVPTPFPLPRAPLPPPPIPPSTVPSRSPFPPTYTLPSDSYQRSVIPHPSHAAFPTPEPVPSLPLPQCSLEPPSHLYPASHVPVLQPRETAAGDVGVTALDSAGRVVVAWDGNNASVPGPVQNKATLVGPTSALHAPQETEAQNGKSPTRIELCPRNGTESRGGRDKEGIGCAKRGGEEVEEEEQEEEGEEGSVWEEEEGKRLERAGVRKVVMVPGGNGRGVGGPVTMVVKKRAPVLQIQLRPERKKSRRGAEDEGMSVRSSHEEHGDSESTLQGTLEEHGTSVSTQTPTLEERGALLTGGRREKGGAERSVEPTPLVLAPLQAAERREGVEIEQGRGSVRGRRKERGSVAVPLPVALAPLQAAGRREGVEIDQGRGSVRGSLEEPARGRGGEGGTEKGALAEGKRRDVEERGVREMSGMGRGTDGGHGMERGSERNHGDAERRSGCEEEERRDGSEGGEGSEGRASLDELKRQQLTEEQLREHAAYKNYTRGEPSPTLYIKNIAKGTTADDLLRLFGAIFPEDSDWKARLNIRLMQEGRMKGQAFVAFPSAELATIALDATLGLVLHNKPIIVQFGRR